MSFRIKSLGIILLPCLLMIGCGSGSDLGIGNGDSDLGGNGGGGSGSGSETDTGTGTGTGTEGESTGTTNVSYLPLSVYEAFKDFSGAEKDGFFTSSSNSVESAALIDNFLINPINATTLETISTAQASDYKVTIDDVEIDATESFPLFQKVIGMPRYLRTALVFDVSGSIADTEIIDALVAEAKAYVNDAKNSTNDMIASQQFVVWAFGKDVEELTAGFTSNTATINAALDAVATRYASKALGTSSNLHRAVVEAVGRYVSSDPVYNFGVDGDNDLIDITLSDGVLLSQMVLFSSGPDTYLQMTESLMVRAIQSQAFSKADETSSTLGDQKLLNKPLFYYVVGGDTAGTRYDALSAEAEYSGYLTLSAGAYSFSDNLIQNQIDAISARIDFDNLYTYKYAFLPREQDHDGIFFSDSTGFNYSLTWNVKHAALAPSIGVGHPSESLATLVEITGPNGEYLSNRAASLSEVTTFAPATRWVSETYGAADYAWSFPAGNGTGVLNADGTYTVTGITAASVPLQLENTVLGQVISITLTD